MEAHRIKRAFRGRAPQLRLYLCTGMAPRAILGASERDGEVVASEGDKGERAIGIVKRNTWHSDSVARREARQGTVRARYTWVRGDAAQTPETWEVGCQMGYDGRGR